MADQKCNGNGNGAAPMMPSRRELLKGGVLVGGVAVTGGYPFLSQLAMAQDEALVPFTDMPEGFAPPRKDAGGVYYQDTRNIDSFYTDNEQFYVVQHYGQPVVDENDYRLRITGLVDRPLEITLDELRARPRVELTAGFECGGNGPGVFQGLIGNARWGGVRLRDLLAEAGIRESGTEVVFYGADRGTETIRNQEVQQSFGRSLSQTEAMHEDILVVHEMNGEPLPLYHGAPVRLVVPGWYGVANVKWLEQIHVQDRRFVGKYMGRDYVTLSRREVGGEMRWEERLVTKIHLKSAITRVTRRGDEHRIMGFALNDGTPLRAVEVRIDDGPWQAAEILPEATRYSWKLFELVWRDAAPGEHRIVSRAIDENGLVQATPEEMPEKVTRWENYAQFPRTVRIG